MDKVVFSNFVQILYRFFFLNLSWFDPDFLETQFIQILSDLILILSG